MMDNTQHESVVLVALKCDEVRKVLDSRLADLLSCVPRAQPPSETIPVPHRFVGGSQQSRRRSRRRVWRAVPHTTGWQNETRPGLQDEDRLARRSSSSLKISVRTVSQGTAWTRPSATSRARRSNSATHATATSSAGSSRLESKSSATRARSRRGRRSASARSSSVDIDLSLALGVVDQTFSGSGHTSASRWLAVPAVLSFEPHLRVHVFGDKDQVPARVVNWNARVLQDEEVDQQVDRDLRPRRPSAPTICRKLSVPEIA